MAKQDGLESLVADFVVKLRGVIREQALEAVRASLSGGSPVRAVSAPRNGHGKGQKRDASALDALQVRFHGFIAKNPGLRIEEINRELGTTTKELALPIRKLIAAKAIRTQGAKRSTKYFAGSRKTKT